MPEPEQEPELTELLTRTLGIIIRRRWWVLLAACGTTLAVIAVLRQLPNRYTSEATLLVVQQQVPERYVVPNSTTDIGSVLQAMKREVLSRTRLLKIIGDFGLYRDRARDTAPETLIAWILRDINIIPIDDTRRGEFTAFRISFTAGNPAVAQSVTSTLTSLFIDENVKTREQQATDTTRFLHEQVEAKRKVLAEQEQRLRDFKMQYIGELPEQQQGNLGIMAGLQTQLQNTMASMSRAEERRVYLESLLNGYARQATVGAGGVSVLGGTSPTRVLNPVEAAASELTRLQAAKASLLSRYTREHPDVVKTEREIASTEQMLRLLKAAPPAAKGEDGVAAVSKAQQPSAVDIPEDPTVAQLRSQLAANRVERENLAKDERQLKASIAQYQNRINQTPVREQQQAAIARDTEALRQEYAELQKKEQASQLATDLEKQQGGQKFRLIDPASLPIVPSSPKRLKMSFGGAAFGLLLGVALAFLRENSNRTFHAEQELNRSFAPPMVVGIPLLLTPIEERSRVWKAAIEWVVACLLVSVVATAEFYLYRFG